MPCLPRNAVAKLNVHGSSLENEVVDVREARKGSSFVFFITAQLPRAPARLLRYATCAACGGGGASYSTKKSLENGIFLGSDRMKINIA
jgi:hypothetical protein